jgi:hypothetical protein
MHLSLKRLLNHVERLEGFVYESSVLTASTIEIRLRAHERKLGKCSVAARGLVVVALRSRTVTHPVTHVRQERWRSALQSFLDGFLKIDGEAIILRLVQDGIRMLAQQFCSTPISPTHSRGRPQPSSAVGVAASLVVGESAVGASRGLFFRARDS